MRPAPRSSLLASGPKRHAFVVDDEPEVRTFVSNVLIAQGFATHQFSNGAAVEAALKDLAPQVIVLDLSLDDSDAIEVIRALAAAHYGGDVLLISGHDDATLKDVQAIGQNRGMAMLSPLHKPFRAEELRERLAALVDRPPPSADLAAALANNWLELWYQPKIDLKTMLFCGAEALIRMRHPVNGLLPPSDFLPRSGDPLYSPLTEYIVRRSLADWSVFAERGLTNRLAINVPASILQRPDFVATVRKHLPRHPRFPGLIVEITEDEAIRDPELAREIAVQLKLYNVHVSIDDFGSGYSTLSRLKELPFAEIKLDRRFVNGCARDARMRTMCEAVIDLARRFGISAVAEGVERLEDLKILKQLGYDIAQGYYFAKPMRSTDFVELLVSRALKA